MKTADYKEASRKLEDWRHWYETNTRPGRRQVNERVLETIIGVAKNVFDRMSEQMRNLGASAEKLSMAFEYGSRSNGNHFLDKIFRYSSQKGKSKSIYLFNWINAKFVIGAAVGIIFGIFITLIFIL